MHFYCFLLFLSTDFTDFTDLSLCLEPQTTQTDAKIILISYFCAFLRLLWLILAAHPGARTWCHAFAVVGVVLLAILTDRSSQQTKILRL